jgi:hypothetical protein
MQSRSSVIHFGKNLKTPKRYKRYSNMTFPQLNILEDSDEEYWDALDVHHCCDNGKKALVQLSQCVACGLLLCPTCECTCPDCDSPCCEYCIVPNRTAPVACYASVKRISALDAGLRNPFSFAAISDKLTPQERAYFTNFRSYVFGKFQNSPGTWIFKPPRRLKDMAGVSLYCFSDTQTSSSVELTSRSSDACTIYCGFGPLIGTYNVHGMEYGKTSFGWWAFHTPDSPAAFHRVHIATPTGTSLGPSVSAARTKRGEPLFT